jgi:pimeloyl-ACP methyl ester carboxylesterase
MQVEVAGRPFEVEQSGNPSGPPLIMIMGLGMQLTSWPEGFVEQLGASGFRVIRFDNRDAGLSVKWDHVGVPNVARAAMRQLFRLPVHAPYSLDDMARDTVGIMDALQIAKAHVVGASMGGMIGQILTARFADRVGSFTCIMSSTGARHLPGPRWRARQAILRPPRSRSIEHIVEHGVDLFKTIGSPRFPTPASEMAARVRRGVERSYYPDGTARQIVSVVAAPDRTPLVASIRQPMAIIHGADDPLIIPAAAWQMARAKPDALCDVIDGMGHDLPEALWDRFVQTIRRTAGV